MKEKMVPVLLRFVKSVRLQRGGCWRAARAGIVAVVVLVWVWVYLVPSPAQTPPSLALDDWSSRFPNLQVAAPISDPRQAAPLMKPVAKVERDDREEVDKTNNEDKIDSVKVENGGSRRGEGGAITEDEKKKKKKKSKRMKIKETEEAQETNPRYNRIHGQHAGLGKLEEGRLFPKMFPKRRLVLPGESEVMVEEDEDEEDYEEEEEEEAGKWKGRNMDENDAMEELDEVAEVDDKNNNNNNGIAKGSNNNNNGNNGNNIVNDKNKEEVGGEAVKRKRERRDKQQKKTGNGNNRRQNAINLQNSLKNDLTENRKPGHRPQQKKGNDLPDLDLVVVEEEMRARRSRVRQVCARYGLGPHAPPGATEKVKYPPTPAYETFYIDRGDRLAWCPVYKAASTSWLYGFLGLAGISESYVKNTKEQVSTVARRVWPALPYDEAKEALNTYVKAIVVRHPFERLASAFRDKLEKVAGGEAHGTEHFYQKYGRKIVEKYRKRDGTQRNQESHPGNVDHQKNRESYQGNSGAVPPPLRYSNALDGQPAPPPPLRYSNALDPHQPPPPQPPQRYKHILVDEPPPPPPPPPQPKEPTFSEFVRYLIDTDLTLYADDHWLPYYLSCTPCLLDFDVIAKFETLDRDQAYLLRKTNLLDKLRFSWRHLTKGNRTKDVVKKYFAQVPKKDLLSLYSKYRLDFEMFDYSVDEYLTYVIN